MKDGKYLRAARQLMMKQGPIYDRWKAAMDVRGEQKRCKDCKWFAQWVFGWCGLGRERLRRRVNPGQFACKRFIPKEGR